MTSLPTLHPPSLAAACLALAAGGLGLALHPQWPQAAAGTPLWLAPMVGIVEPCLLAPRVPTADLPDWQQGCTGPDGSAAALLNATLAPLDGPPGAHAVGYTLPVPLLTLFERSSDSPDGWAIRREAVARLARTVRDTDRPLVLYLFSTHFGSGAPLETALAGDAANLAWTPDGPLPTGRYYGAPIVHWSLARTDNAITARRQEAIAAVLDALCQLAPAARARIRNVSLLGELHHLFPDFESGMGFNGPYRVTDYSPASVAGFQRFLRERFGDVAALNQATGGRWARFEDVRPPSKDFRTDPGTQPWEHIDSFAQGSLPVAGWTYLPPAPGERPATVEVERNGRWAGQARIALARQDVRQAHPEFGTVDTGWRLDLDFRGWPLGTHRLDLFVRRAQGPRLALGTRTVTITDGRPASALPDHGAPLAAPAPPASAPQGHIDSPAEAGSYRHNPLVALWHRYRGQQVVDYLKVFDRQVSQSCLHATPRSTHQIIPFSNPGWDSQKFAIDASLAPATGLQLGVSLYGEAAYGHSFTDWLGRSARPYGITEFHPLKAMEAPALQALLARHARHGARFVSFFLEPRWEGRLVPRPHNLFSFDPANPQFDSDALYRAMVALQARGTPSAPQEPDHRPGAGAAQNRQ